MGSDELKKLHEKEAIRKKETYWKNKKENPNKLEVIKIERKTRKTEQIKNINNDELIKEREKEELRKREAYIKNKNSDSSKIVEKKIKRKMQKLEKTKNEFR